MDIWRKSVFISGLLLTTGQFAVAADQPGLNEMFDRQALIDSGVDLPPRYGISLLYVNSEYTILTDGFKIGIGGEPPAPSDFVNIDRIDARAQSAGVYSKYPCSPRSDVHGCGRARRSTPKRCSVPKGT